MGQSTLRQVLSAFESGRPLALTQLARELGVSPVQLEDMLQYWVRKGRLREVDSSGPCGSCGLNDGACAFVVELPRSYELVTPAEANALPVLTAACRHQPA